MNLDLEPGPVSVEESQRIAVVRVQRFPRSLEWDHFQGFSFPFIIIIIMIIDWVSFRPILGVVYNQSRNRDGFFLNPQ